VGGALAVEDVDLLQGLDVLAGEATGQMTIDDCPTRHPVDGLLGVRAQPLLAAEAALEAELARAPSARRRVTAVTVMRISSR
jgi:hypothetical protein